MNQQQPRHGWLISGLGLVCYRILDDGTELYGVFTFGGTFIRHLTEAEA